MKRILAFLLASLLLAGMGASAFADDGGASKNQIKGLDKSTDITVTGTYVKADEPAPVYFVTVKWDSFAFKVGVDGGLIWQPKEHKYLDTRTALWASSDDTYNEASITVTNRSNVPVNVNSTFTPAEEMYGVEVVTSSNFDKPIQLRDATSGRTGTPATYNLLIHGTLDFAELDKLGNEVSVTLGTIKITVTAVDGVSEP